MRAAEIVQREFAYLKGVVHAKRLACFALIVEAILAASSVSLTAVGRARNGSARTKSAIKQVDRLLGNRHLHQEAELFFIRFGWLLPENGRPVLLIDWTDIGTLWAALTVTLVVEGRGVVLWSEVHPRAKENNPRVEASVLKALRRFVPTECKPIIVSDAGFRGPWLSKVLNLGWDFVARVRGRVAVRALGKSTWIPVKELWSAASSRPRDLGRHELARYLPVEARLVTVWKDKQRRKKALPQLGHRKQRSIRSAREPWILATSLYEIAPAKIVGLYSLRMRIEQTFRDQKCPRFGLALDQVRTKSLQRIRTYVLLAIVASFVAMLVGAAAEAAKIHRHYQANTVRKRRVLSWARLGRELLRRGDTDLLLLPPSRWADLLCPVALPA